MRIKRWFWEGAALVLLLLLPCREAHAQRAGITTNLMEYINMGTLNAEASYAFSRYWTVNAGARYNPFSFKMSGKEVNNRQQSYYAGVRYWPWYAYSGWWVGGKARYQEYNSGGLLSRRTDEGDRFGLGFSAGYAYMLGRHFNLDFGLGLWGGYDKYTTYSCPTCGVTTGAGERFFVLPDEVLVAITYVF